MAEWLSFLMLSGAACIFTACAGIVLLLGRSFSCDWTWIFPLVVFILLAWLMWTCAADIAPFTVHKVNRG